MTRHSFLILATLLTHLVASGQDMKACSCSKTKFAGTKADTTFHFTNRKTIVLCGYKNPESHPTSFSEFIISVCGSNTIIDFWDATLTCRVKTDHDTLFVEQIESLPTGRNLAYQPTVWSVEKIYFKGQQVKRNFAVNRKIRKYTSSEIKTVLQNFKTAKIELTDETMELGNKLFIATISGDKAARKYFKEFRTHFGVLDGAFKEEYDDPASKLELWDKKNSSL